MKIAIMALALIASASVLTAGFYLSGCHYHSHKGKELKLNTEFWVCSSTYIKHYPARAGLLTRAGRTSDWPAYDAVKCNQWSAKMSDGTIGGDG